MDDDRWIARIAMAADAAGEPGPAPARLKSKLYSRLVERLAQGGPLRGLTVTRTSGHGLCVFERAVARLGSEQLDSTNPCRVCHARVLGERLEHAPIFWPNCPYSDFHSRSRK